MLIMIQGAHHISLDPLGRYGGGRQQDDKPVASPRALPISSWHRRAVHQGGLDRPERDTAPLPQLRRQSGAAATLRPGLQPGQFPAPPGAADESAALDAHALRDILIKIGCKVVYHTRQVVFQLAGGGDPSTAIGGDPAADRAMKTLDRPGSRRYAMPNGQRRSLAKSQLGNPGLWVPATQTSTT